MSRTLEYPKTARNTVVRRGHRGKYDLETIHTLINTSLVLNVSFAPSPDTDEDFPVILPMIGVMGSVSSSHLSSGFCQPPEASPSVCVLYILGNPQFQIDLVMTLPLPVYSLLGLGAMLTPPYYL